MDTIDIKNTLISIRESKGYSKRTVSEMAGIPYTTYIKYESGERKDVSMQALCKLADFYGVTTDYLLGREPKPPEPNPFEEMNLSPDAEKKVLETYNAFPAPARAFLLDVIRQLGNVMNDVPEAQQSSMEYVGTVGEELERREQVARAEAEALRKDTA